MAYKCPHCGAIYPSDETCKSRFDQLLAVELVDPAYFAVHQLAVPCYTLQHNAYSREGWLETWRLLANLVGGLDPAEARRQMRRSVDSGVRTYSIVRGPKLVGVEAIGWSRTIADIRLDTAAHYCADVRAWAERVLADSEALVRAADTGRPQRDH